MNKTISKLIAEIGKNAFQQLQTKEKKSSQNKQDIEIEEARARAQFYAKINFYNQYLKRYLSRIYRLRIFILSTIAFDYLLLITNFNHEKINLFLKQLIDWNLSFNICGYSILALASWQIFTSHKQNKNKSLISAQTFLILVVILIIFGSTLQILKLAENPNNQAKVIFQIAFMIAAIFPIIKNIWRANRVQYRPEMSTIFLILQLILPLIVFRIIHLVAVLCIVMLGSREIELYVLSIAGIVCFTQNQKIEAPNGKFS